MCAIRSSFFSLVLFISLLLFTQARCSSDQPMVEVTLSGLPDGASSLSIDATLGGALLDGDRRTVQPADSTFDVRLASNSTGTKGRSSPPSRSRTSSRRSSGPGR